MPVKYNSDMSVGRAKGIALKRRALSALKRSVARLKDYAIVIKVKSALAIAVHVSDSSFVIPGAGASDFGDFVRV